MNKHGLHPYFTLHSFYIKPMDAPPPGTTIWVKGFTKKRGDPLVWHVDFPSGYHLPFQVKMEEYSGEAWDNIQKVEIAADFGYDSLDWEFCMDNLEVQYHRLPKDDGASAFEDQWVLDNDNSEN